MTTLVLVIKKIESEDKTKYNTFHSHSKAKTVINEKGTDDVFKSIYITITSNIQKSLSRGSGWDVVSVIEHSINIWKYNPVAGSSYINLNKELDHPRKGLINIQNADDNEYFKWYLFRYLNPADYQPARITEVDEDFAKMLDFKDIKFPFKVRDIHKIEKEKNSIGISVFGYEIRTNILLRYQKNVVKKNILIYY